MSHSLAHAQATRRQSRTVRELGLAGCAWLLMFSGAITLWLNHSGVPLDAWTLGACTLAPLIGLALACASTADARQYALHVIAATLMLPILLLFWASSAEMAEPPATAQSLDAQALFHGAEAVQDADVRGGEIVLLRTAQFADGTELRLTRFEHEEAARRYVAMLAQAMPTEPVTEGGRQGLRLLGSGVGVFILIERHGADLLETRARERHGALARLAVQQVPLPQSNAAAPAEPPASWPFFTGAGVAHALVFVALIAWAGSHVTRVPALQGAPVATPDQLRARLLSLAETFDITETDSRTFHVDASPSLRRTHHITLRIDTRHGCVRVNEKLGVEGDAPLDADEACMRDGGDELVDAARPDAQQLWASTLQATMVVPTRLAAVPLRLHARRAELPPGYAATLDGEGVLTALCAIVTRSGWHWQPRLFGH